MNGAPLLLVSLSNIGDAIMTTPVLEAMHALRPDAPIDIVADRRSSIVFDQCPYRGRIVHKDKGAPLRGAAALVRELRDTEYEWVVDLRTDFLPLLLRLSNTIHWPLKCRASAHRASNGRQPVCLMKVRMSANSGPASAMIVCHCSEVR